MNNLYFIFSCLGLAGGLLCATGDILFDLKGRGNQKLGTSKNIDSNWTKMADWRQFDAIQSYGKFDAFDNEQNHF